MPANLPQPYIDAEARFKEARSTDEKIDCLQRMYALLPKHKGTEKMQAELKRKLSKLRDELQSEKKRGGAKGPSHHVPREGAGQVALVGPPNAGKTQLLVALTRASCEISDYPFTTREPQPGMMPWQDIAVQLVDAPPLAAEHPLPWLLELVRHADLVLLFIDLAADDLLERSEELLRMLDEAQIELVEPGTPVDDRRLQKPVLVVANKDDQPKAADNLEIFLELFAERLPFELHRISALHGAGLEALREAVVAALRVIRVYTKQPGKPADHGAPFVLPRGSSLTDLARLIHRDLEQQLKFARVWNEHTDGLRVPRDYALEDKDVVELHT